MAELTPMMAQYKEIKNQYKDCLLFFRLGDFYEMFFEDACIASSELDLTLTGRDCGLAERAPMCGVPYHAAKGYIAKLLEKGYKVAICDQMEEPSKGKTIVRREVTRVVTPGTVTDENMLDVGQNNYIACVADCGRVFGFAFADVSTGAFYVSEFPKPMENAANAVIDELARIGCAELIVNDRFHEDLYPMIPVKPYTLEKRAFEPERAKERLCAHFGVVSLSAYGVSDESKAQISAAGALLTYLFETQKGALPHVVKLSVYRRARYMALDASSRRNLELTKTVGGQKRGSLLWALNDTKTPPGARTLRRWIEQPLTQASDIQARLDAVDVCVKDGLTRAELRAQLSEIKDIERITGRIVTGNATGREMVALARSLAAVPAVKDLLSRLQSPMFRYFRAEMDDCADTRQTIELAITDEPPATIKDGGFVRPGYNAALDECCAAKQNGKTWLLELEAAEREASGIKNLKVKYNRVFGYYFEVTNANLDAVPPHFIRRQTLAGHERFTTARLKEIEDAILGADEKAIAIELEIFAQLKERVVSAAARLLSTAHMLAAADALCALAETAAQNGYVKPTINTEGRIHIKDGRHPVIERLVENRFVANDTKMDMQTNRLLIITGPNMAGKSTYMRQVALITLMAQIGSFVPAEKADVAVVDRIFTRVGASDDLATGQSTFMVEMNEVANILNNATKNSLIILDEIGRGTSTFDGLSIAWAVLEHIADASRLGAKTLFATHYHELTELEGKVDGVTNVHATVKETAGGIAFLRKIKPGGAGHSYGVQVAKLAGLPDRVLRRAGEILALLDSVDVARSGENETEGVAYGKSPKASFSERLLFKEMMALDLDAPPFIVMDQFRELRDRLARAAQARGGQ